MTPDASETTLTFEHDRGTVTVYTTRQDVYEGLLDLPTPPLRHTDLQPGYELVYRESDIRDVSDLIRP